MASPSSKKDQEGPHPPPPKSLTGYDGEIEKRNAPVESDDPVNFRAGPMRRQALAEEEEDRVDEDVGEEDEEDANGGDEDEMDGENIEDENGSEENPLADLNQLANLPPTGITWTPINGLNAVLPQAGPVQPPAPPGPPPVASPASTGPYPRIPSLLPGAPLPVPNAALVARFEPMIQALKPARVARNPPVPGAPRGGRGGRGGGHVQTRRAHPRSPSWTDAESLVLLKIYQEYRVNNAFPTHLEYIAIHDAIVWPHIAYPVRTEASFTQQMGLFTRVAHPTGPSTRDYNRVPQQIAVLEAGLAGLPLPANGPLRFLPTPRGAGGTMVPHNITPLPQPPAPLPGEVESSDDGTDDLESDNEDSVGGKDDSDNSNDEAGNGGKGGSRGKQPAGEIGGKDTGNKGKRKTSHGEDGTASPPLKKSKIAVKKARMAEEAKQRVEMFGPYVATPMAQNFEVEAELAEDARKLKEARKAEQAQDKDGRKE
ncbi:unnamed protein product [Zymoseptoria tritici ST99CH_1E4]|uniref:Uncharacterized protein n=1 Tax=Zymoseptoria tritici ST99CH_1E4 TaxID=1276532 RepID=A0A2H1GP36_ZYMTR|nr:unnamed protein product [Zymoseptoria tritici ST99CH_1E4]